MRQTEEKANSALRKAYRQHHDRHCADRRADHAEPALAQRGAEARLTDDRRRRAGPRRIVELEPKRDVQRQADSSPKAQTEENRRSRDDQLRASGADAAPLFKFTNGAGSQEDDLCIQCLNPVRE